MTRAFAAPGCLPPRPRTWRVFAAAVAAALTFAMPVRPQAPPAGGAAAAGAGPKVFVKSSVALPDLEGEIAFVRFVQREEDAQVLAEITSVGTAAGEVFSIALTGRKEFAGSDNLLSYPAGSGAGTDAVRKDLVRILKLGLLRYALKTPAAGRIGLAFQDQVKPTAVADPWNFWVFSLGIDGFLQGEQTYGSQMWSGNVSAQRVTPEWKIRTAVGVNWQKSTYAVEDFNYASSMNSRSFDGVIVRSLGEHWSVGGYLKVEASTFDNFQLLVQATPALEYDLFPYSESTRRQLRLLYTVGPTFGWYQDETIYDKMKETLWSQSLAATLELKQSWGVLSATLQGSHYFHDLSKNRLSLSGDLSLRIFKGLNFNIDGGGSRIRDQLSLPKGGATLEEVLLQRRQLATTYNYFFSAGLSLAFGSTNSNVVNPRFGSANGGTSIQISN